MKKNLKIKEKIVSKIYYIQKRNWMITVLIFSIVFVAAVVVWQDCILSPQPSQLTFDNISKVEQEYQTKTMKIESNHKKLKDQVYRFDNPINEINERVYFNYFKENNSASLRYESTQGNFNPQLVQ